MKTKLTITLFLLFIVNTLYGQTALDFDSSTGLQKVRIPAITCPTEFTIEAWIYYKGGGATYTTILEFGNDAPYIGLTNGNFGLYNIAYAPPESLELNQWTHVAVTYSNSLKETKIYINGILENTVTNKQVSLSGVGAGIGFNSGDTRFNGMIDEVRIWNVVRSEYDINSTINACLTGSEIDLYAYYNFNEGSGDIANDLTASSFDGTLETNGTIQNAWKGFDSCSASGDNSPCSDGIDNDGDGFIDCDDPDECTSGRPASGCVLCHESSSFADVLLDSNRGCPGRNLVGDPIDAIGSSDNKSVTLGQGGSIKLGFTNNLLINSGGDEPDLYVFETGANIEATSLALRPANDFTRTQLQNANIPDIDSDGFFEFGSIGGSTRAFDIDAVIPGFEKEALMFNAIIVTDIVDTNDNCNRRDAGAEIDAVCALSSIERTYPDLMVDNITFSTNDIVPKSEFHLSWDVKNIGEYIAVGGWKEQVFLVSQNSDKRYLLGNKAYTQSLNNDQTINRQYNFNIPANIGFDGIVKVEVVMTPDPRVGEPATFKENNEAVSVENATLLKKINLTIDKTEIIKNSDDQIRIELARSSAIDIAEEFTINTNANQYFELPLNITFEINESSNFAFIRLKPSTDYVGDQEITITATGASYPEETISFTLIEDQQISLSMEYDPDFGSTVGSTIDFTLTATSENNADKTIQISSDNTKRLQLPEEVIIIAGEKTVTFQGILLDPNAIEKKVNMKVYANTEGYLSASSDITLNGINIPAFEITLEHNSISESDGIDATFATIKRTSQTEREVTINISTSPNNRLILPESITFEENEIEKTFNIGVIDNSSVEGDQNITITSRVRFTACNCTDETDLSTEISTDLEVIDNDGLAFIVSASPTTIKTGATENTLKIERNTENTSILENPVTVTLSSTVPSMIQLPATVIIPANQKETTITFNTIIDGALTGDQNIRIAAEAENYSTGFSWVLLTDQNKPDVIITDMDAPDQTEAAKEMTINYTIKNQGFADFPKGSKLEYYLSPTNDISNLEPFTTSILNQEIKAGESYAITETIQLPIISGKSNLIVVINNDSAINELSLSNNQSVQLIDFLPSYSVNISLDKAVYKPNENIFISGTAIRLDGTGVPNTDVDIIITNLEFTRKNTLKTGANGSFEYTFVPLENEAGNYEVTASYPSAIVPPQASFDILGFELLEQPQYIKWEPIVDFPLGKQFVLKNNTSVQLTGVKINLPEDAKFTITQTPIVIEPGEEVILDFTIKSNETTIENNYQENQITITSNEGAVLKEIIYYHSKSKEAQLVVDPISINTTMVRDTIRLYEFTVRNIGEVAANNIKVLLPDLNWLKLRSPEIINRIEPGEIATIALALSPTETEQINVPISGTLVLKEENSIGLSVPFRIETVSEVTGTLIIDATDEYTYNTASAPHVAGAKVVVKHPYSGTIIAEGITNTNGLFEVPTLNEGYYTISVSVDKHNPYQNNILVDPGKTTRVNAFMQYQAVTYSWDVVPTEVTDEYDISLVTQFETNIPKPVVVMELDNPNLDLAEGETRLVNLTITNHGLIAANDVSINIDNIPGYEVNPLIKTMEILNAKTTVVVPILLKKVVSASNQLASKSINLKQDSSPCSFKVVLEAYFICNQKEKMFSFAFFITKKNCQFSLPEKDSIGSGGGNRDIPATFSTGTPITLDICDPCTKKIISLLLKYVVGKNSNCYFDFITSTDGAPNAYKNLLDCTGLLPQNSIPAPPWVGIVEDAISFIEVCNELLQDLFQKSTISKQKVAARQISSGSWDFIRDDFQKILDAYNAQKSIAFEYFKNDALLEDSEAYLIFLTEINENLNNETVFTTSDIERIKEKVKGSTIEETYIDSFTSRWNTTIEAWNNTVFSPNTQYPDIVDQVKIDEYLATIEALNAHTFQKGFVSVVEMYNSDIKAIEDFKEEKSKDEASVCATVSIEFSQNITMTREAFEGTLKINNSSDKTIKDINLDLIVTDEFGEDKTHLFQINKEAFLNGTGAVTPSNEGKGLVIFIPTKAAAPQIAASYSFGGVMSYFDEEINERVYVTLNPVTLLVNPSPDLILDYFIQRDILGDDALTDHIVEPSIPAELSLMITNDGFGDARNVKVASTQPRIIDNEKGLLIDFNIIGSNFNNEPRQLGLLNVDFGNILPKTSSIGQWFFTSSLLGHFVKYDLEVNHTSSFGNKSLSLIKASYVHELIKSIRGYQEGNDEIADFLVNDNADANDTPDRIFFSNTASEEVLKAETVTSSNVIALGNFTSTITINPSTTGWNYGNIEDPGGYQFKLDKIVRDVDNVEIPLENFWQTTVTLRDGLNPKYENKLHVLDKVTQATTYTVYYVSKDQNTPTIIALEGAPISENTEIAVQSLTVKFSKEIDESTFDVNNIQIIRQGEFIAANEISITKEDATTYTLGLEQITTQSGYYQVDVTSVGVNDLLGNEGNNTKRATWLQFLNELGILQFESDQVNKSPINTITVTFNKQIDLEEFTSDKITINENPVSTDILISKIDDFTYSISGITDSNQDNGAYTISIDLPKMTAIDNEIGLSIQSYKWTVDTNLPTVTELQPMSQGGINTQNITEINIQINRKIINSLKISAFEFTKDGQEINIPVSILILDDLTYRITGLTDYTKEDGNYKLTIDQSILQDENGNFGEGFAEVSWSVSLKNLIALSALSITPDRGVSNTDNITAGNNIQLVYTTLENNLTVEVYELLATSEVLAYTHLREKAGEFSIPLVDKLGGKRFKVIATDQNGNRSAPEIVSSFIDFTSIVSNIEPIKDVINDCYDFDSVRITFSDALTENTFTKDAITLKSSGIVIPKDQVTISKIDDKTYLLENIKYEGDGLVSLEIDKTKISKKLSGFIGNTTDRKILGIPNKYAVGITGSEAPNLIDSFTYVAPESIQKYDWIVINGEIINTVDNTITVKWNALGEQSLMLRYQTPFGCDSATIKNVIVTEEASNDGEDVDVVIDIDTNPDPEEIKNSVKLVPVPNNGEFTIHTNIALQNCTIAVYDLFGKIIYLEKNVTISENLKEISIPYIPSGMYLLKIENENEKINLKFVVK